MPRNEASPAFGVVSVAIGVYLDPACSAWCCGTTGADGYWIAECGPEGGSPRGERAVGLGYVTVTNVT